MSFEVTSHDVVPVGRSKNGMTAALRSLQVNQSIHVPCDGSDPSKQRVRIGAICNYVGKGCFSVRIRPDKSFDVYRVK